ncbi:helix-turn-helix domain-containing protein [Pseudomonas sp. BN515]|uniref:helix-turn-helix domain-containing protein n=1 Tax=Pseudomonas sp. BN515 TaxID=2567892 RepID=UPI002453A81B|nr:helix-turn-helix domain-containing protein [Pseudomonas sp. BN515]MDH4871994.1 helix-turn-helix domain-containing protein [Pseudomonas sp. BN515]
MSKPDPIGEQFRLLQKQLAEIRETIGELAELFEQRSRVNRPDMLTEVQMAEHLGITKRAIQGRRSRGQIPPEVCQKIGSTWFYSLKRYEAWLESQWPIGAIPQPTIPAPRGTIRKSARQPVLWLK